MRESLRNNDGRFRRAGERNFNELQVAKPHPCYQGDQERKLMKNLTMDVVKRDSAHDLWFGHTQAYKELIDPPMVNSLLCLDPPRKKITYDPRTMTVCHHIDVTEVCKHDFEMGYCEVQGCSGSY